jgi:hypothetical protein
MLRKRLESIETEVRSGGDAAVLDSLQECFGSAELLRAIQQEDQQQRLLEKAKYAVAEKRRELAALQEAVSMKRAAAGEMGTEYRDAIAVLKQEEGLLEARLRETGRLPTFVVYEERRQHLLNLSDDLQAQIEAKHQKLVDLRTLHASAIRPGDFPAELRPKATLYSQYASEMLKTAQVRQLNARKHHRELTRMRAKQEADMHLAQVNDHLNLESLRRNYAALSEQASGLERLIGTMEGDVLTSGQTLRGMRREHSQLRVALWLESSLHQTQRAAVAEQIEKLDEASGEFSSIAEAEHTRIAAEEAAKWSPLLEAPQRQSQELAESARAENEAKLRASHEEISSRHEERFTPLLQMAQAEFDAARDASAHAVAALAAKQEELGTLQRNVVRLQAEASGEAVPQLTSEEAGDAARLAGLADELAQLWGSTKCTPAQAERFLQELALEPSTSKAVLQIFQQEEERLRRTPSVVEGGGAPPPLPSGPPPRAAAAEAPAAAPQQAKVHVSRRGSVEITMPRMPQ